MLVLDDMWNKSYADWVKLLAPMESGACGSKIIVTTRNQNVALIMCSVSKSFQLRELDAAHCWLLFVKHASIGRNMDQGFKVIGEKIVRKCKGLPLAAKIIGGLLRRKLDVAAWENVLNSNIWDLPDHSILPALRLSYHHLPPRL